MFESLVAFGVPATISPSALLKALASLRESKLVVGYVVRTKPKPKTRWFTLLGQARRSSEHLITALTTKLGSLTVVSVIEHSGAMAVVHHELGDEGVTTTHETFEEEGKQKTILGRALTKLYGKGTLEELVAAVDSWSYAKATTGKSVDAGLVDRELTWAIETYEASDIAFLSDDSGDDADEAPEDAGGADDVVQETDAERAKRKARVSALFGEPDQIEEALAACRQCRAQGDFTWYSAEHYALESRQRWNELFELAHATITTPNKLDRYGNAMAEMHRHGMSTLADAATLLQQGLREEATVLVRFVRIRFPNALDGPYFRQLRTLQ